MDPKVDFQIPDPEIHEIDDSYTKLAKIGERLRQLHGLTFKSTILIKKTRQIAKIDEKLETVIEKSPNPTFLHGFFAPKSPILAPIWGGPARANCRRKK